MHIPQEVADILLNADAKALATSVGDQVNVVPVSSIRIVDDRIWLVNCFMGKTVENILSNPNVSLACWKGGTGYQIQAHATYDTEGTEFEKAKQWIGEILPERVVKGLLILEPAAIFDVSPSKTRAGVQIC